MRKFLKLALHIVYTVYRFYDVWTRNYFKNGVLVGVKGLWQHMVDSVPHNALSWQSISGLLGTAWEHLVQSNQNLKKK